MTRLRNASACAWFGGAHISATLHLRVTKLSLTPSPSPFTSKQRNVLRGFPFLTRPAGFSHCRCHFPNISGWLCSWACKVSASTHLSLQGQTTDALRLLTIREACPCRSSTHTIYNLTGDHHLAPVLDPYGSTSWSSRLRHAWGRKQRLGRHLLAVCSTHRRNSSSRLVVRRYVAHGEARTSRAAI